MHLLCECTPCGNYFYKKCPSPKSEVVHETKFSLKISYATHACLAQLDQHQTCKSVMVLWVQISLEATLFFLRHLDANFVQKWQKCQICVTYENLNYVVLSLERDALQVI